MATQLRPIESDEEQPGRPSYEAQDSSIAEQHGLVRRGMLWGASAGFLFGLMPLVASTLFGAIAGATVAKLSHAKFDKGSAPRIYFR